MMAATVVVLAKLLVVVHLGRVERHHGHGASLEQLAGQRNHVGANHQGVRRLAHLRIADVRLQGEHFTVHGDVDHQHGVALHAGFHLSGLHGGLLADAVVLDERANLVSATLPVGKGVHALQGIRQLAHHGQFGCWAELLQGILSTGVLFVINTRLRGSSHEGSRRDRKD